MSGGWYPKDDGEEPLESLTSEEIQALREALSRRDANNQPHFDSKEIQVLKNVIETLSVPENLSALQELIKQHQVSRYWAEARVKLWALVKAVLAGFLMVVAVIEGWTKLVVPYLGGK